MAKQLVGPIERHVEKAVVGAAGLFLIGVLALYLVSSPNKVAIEGAGAPVSPGGIDAVLAQKAQQVREQIRAGRAKTEPVEPLADKLAAALNPFPRESLGTRWAEGGQLGPPVPIIDAPSVIEGSAKLVEVLPMPRPQVHFGRSTLLLGNEVAATNWVTVASRFEVLKQMEAQALAYGETRKDLIYASVDLQRRAQRPDGSWSDDDWEDVTAWPAFEPPATPPLVLEGEGKKVFVPKENMDALNRYRDYLSDPGRQQSILRPLFVEVLNGDRWTLPRLSSYRELLVFDDEIRSPEFESETLEDRYGAGESEPVAPTGAGPAVSETEATLRAAEKKLAAATSVEECIEVYNMLNPITTGAASAGEKNRARKLQAEAEQKESDIRRRGLAGGAAAGGERRKKRQRQPQQVVWAHDAAPDSVPSGRTVQYRIRMSLLNQLAGEPLLFRNKEDATQVFVHGPWSEPSDPIHVPATERYFVTACDERRQEVSVEMFRWFDGVWVKTRAKFGIGQPLRISARTPAPALNDPTKADNPLVDFSADAVVLDMDVRRPFRESKKGSGKGGVKYPASSTDCAVVLVDGHGRLEERAVGVDKNHPEKDILNQRVWKAPRP